MDNIDTKLVNRVAQSGLKTINLEDDFPKCEMISFDLKDFLFQGLILRENDFRSALNDHNWEQYNGKVLLVFCSTDAIIPVWAYMLVATYASPWTLEVFPGNRDEYLRIYYSRVILSRDYSHLAGERVVIKGCSHKPVPHTAYLQLTSVLVPMVQSVMYGEPCSTVPIYKKPRIQNT